MNHKLTFLFDLDMTLLNTSGLEPYRSSGNWPFVKNHFEMVAPFSGLNMFPHELPAKLKTDGHQIGIVTSSPGWYAKELLEKFDIPYDVLVAYEDTKLHKPEAEPITHALQKLGSEPERVYHIGDTKGDIEASIKANVSSVFVAWGMQLSSNIVRLAPDIWIDKPESLLPVSQIPSLKYIAERYACHAELSFHEGSLLKWQENGQTWIACGRYFATGDIRHGSSQLSQKILELKETDSPSEIFANCLATLFEKATKKPSIITCVPPKSEQRNRFAHIFDLLRERIPSEVQIISEGLKVVKEIPNYKELNQTERRKAIRGAFEPTMNYKGLVWLIDDVRTTGSTSIECIQMLKNKGANAIYPIAFGLDQERLEDKKCPKGHPMRIRTNRDGVRFWGCTKYKKNPGEGEESCRYTEPLN